MVQGRIMPARGRRNQLDGRIVPTPLPSMGLSLKAELNAKDRGAPPAWGGSVSSSKRVLVNYNHRRSESECPEDDNPPRGRGRPARRAPRPSSEEGNGFAPSQSNGTISGFTGFSGNAPSSNEEIPDEDPFKAGYMWRICGEYTLPPPKPPKTNRLPSKTDMTLSLGTLVIECIDRMTGKPVPGAAINVSSTVSGTGYNAASTNGKGSVTDVDGIMVAKVLSTKYLVTTTCTGYYPYGRLGERLLVDVHHGEVTAARMLLVPIKVGVIMTLLQIAPEEVVEEARQRELALHSRGDGGSTMMDMEGGPQENYLFKEHDRRVDLTDEVGRSKRGFLAQLLDSQIGFLEVYAVKGTGEHDRTEERVDLYNTNSDGRCFFYGPDENNNIVDLSEEEKARRAREEREFLDDLTGGEDLTQGSPGEGGERRIGQVSDSMAGGGGGSQAGSGSEHMSAEDIVIQRETVQDLIDSLAEQAFDDVDGTGGAGGGAGAPLLFPLPAASAAPEDPHAPRGSHAPPPYKYIHEPEHAGKNSPPWGARRGQGDPLGGLEASLSRLEEMTSQLTGLGEDSEASTLGYSLSGGDVARSQGGGGGDRGGREELSARQVHALEKGGARMLAAGPLAEWEKETEWDAAVEEVALGGYKGVPRPLMDDELLAHEILDAKAIGAVKAALSGAAAAGGGGGALPISLPGEQGGEGKRSSLRVSYAGNVFGDEPDGRAPHSIMLSKHERRPSTMRKDQSERDKLSIHHLPPGRYTLYIKDPSYTLLFAARRYGGETVTVESIPEDLQRVDFEVVQAGVGYKASINRYDYDAESPAVEDIYTDNTSLRYIGKGPGHAAYTPLELYLRRKPRIQISVHDSINGTDVGALKSLQFVVERWSEGAGPTIEQDEDGALGDEMWGSLMADFPGEPVNTDAIVKRKRYRANLSRSKSQPRGWHQMFSGKLDGSELQGVRSLDEMWVSVANRYRVTVFSEHPYVEWDLVEERRVQWDERPFCFHLERKTVLAVQVQEQWGGEPVEGRAITVDIIPPRPPPPRPRACAPGEDTAAWLRDVVLGLVEHCEDGEALVSRIPTHYDLQSNTSGYARVLIPPGSKVKIKILGGGEFEENGPAASNLEYSGVQPEGVDSEHTVSMQMVRVAYAAVRCLEPLGSEPLADCHVTLYKIEDNNGWVLEPPLELYEGETMVDAGDAEEGLGIAQTLSVQVCAGDILRAVVNRVPVEYCVPMDKYGVRHSSVEGRVEGSKLLLDIMTAIRPRVSVKAFDKGNGTELQGVQFRVMMRAETRSTIYGEVCTEHIESAHSADRRPRADVPPLASAGGKVKLLAPTDPGAAGAGDFDDVHRWPTPRVCQYLRGMGVDDQAVRALGAMGCNGRRLLRMRNPEGDLEDEWLIGVREKKHLARVIHQMQEAAPAPPATEDGDSEWEEEEEEEEEEPEVVLNESGYPEDPDGVDPHRDPWEGSVIEGATVVYESATGAKGHDVLWVEPFMEIMVQLAPTYPYASERLRLSRKADGTTGMKPFEFWIQRDMRAVDFWLEKSAEEYTRFQPRRGGGDQGNVYNDDGTIASVGPDPQKEFFQPTQDAAFRLGKAAMLAMKMGDPSRLPLERTTLLELMAQWGSFFHVGDGACVACVEDGHLEVPVGGVPGDGPIYTDLVDGLPAREAKYCRSPFHTWVIPSGRAVHVGLHEGLYDELTGLTTKQEECMRICQEQVHKIEAYNKRVPMDGRFLFGSDVVVSRSGGVFVVDVSGAMPEGCMKFVGTQLQRLLRTWGEDAARACADPPLFNVIVMDGQDAKYWRAEPAEVVEGSELGVGEWIQGEHNPGVGHCSLTLGLRTAFRHARHGLPVFLIAGSFSDEVPDGTFWAQLDQIRSVGRGMTATPIHVLELFDAPLRASERDMELGAEEDAESGAGEEGGDIFKLLLQHIDEGQTRLLELFREEDKDRSNTLCQDELAHLVMRFIPDVSDDQLRYLQVMLDADGSGDISYKEFVVALRESKAAGVAVRARGGLEVKDILRRIKLHMSEHRIDINQLFVRFDADNSGLLEQQEIAKLVRFLMPSLAPQEIRTIMAQVKKLDINNDGSYSLPELKKALGLERSGPSPREEDASKARGRNEDMGRLLMTIAALTTGRFLRIETTYLRAASELVEVDAVKKVCRMATKELEQIRAFESSYKHRLALDKKEREEERLKRLRKGGAPTIGGKELLAAMGIKPKKKKKLKRPASALPRVAMLGSVRAGRGGALESAASTSSLPSPAGVGAGARGGGLRAERSTGSLRARPASASPAVGLRAGTTEVAAHASPRESWGRELAAGGGGPVVGWEGDPPITPSHSVSLSGGRSTSSLPSRSDGGENVRWATPIADMREINDSSASVGPGTGGVGASRARTRARVAAGKPRRRSPLKGGRSSASPDKAGGGGGGAGQDREVPRDRRSPSYGRAKRVSPHGEKALRAKIAKDMEDIEIPLSAPRAPRQARTAQAGYWAVEDGQAIFVGAKGARGQPLAPRRATFGGPAATATPGLHTRESWQYMDVPGVPQDIYVPEPIEAVSYLPPPSGRPGDQGERPSMHEWEMGGAEDSSYNV